MLSQTLFRNRKVPDGIICRENGKPYGKEGFLFCAAETGKPDGMEECAVTTQEIAVYREIQRNTQKGIRAIDAIADKVYDPALALRLSEQTLQYSELYNAAAKQLIAGKAENYRSGFLEDAGLRAKLHYGTLLNTSSGHIAELLIRSNTESVLEMEKALKHHENIGKDTEALAKRMIECGEQNVSCLKAYL